MDPGGQVFGWLLPAGRGGMASAVFICARAGGKTQAFAQPNHALPLWHRLCWLGNHAVSQMAWDWRRNWAGVGHGGAVSSVRVRDSSPPSLPSGPT